MLSNRFQYAEDFSILLQVGVKKWGILRTFAVSAVFYGNLIGMCPNIRMNVPVLRGKLAGAWKAGRDSRESYELHRGD